MSRWVTLRNNCGRLYRTNLSDFWEISLTIQDPQIPNLPLETAGGGPTYYGILKRWTGAAWVKEPLQTYLGGSWQSKPLKRWSGASWLLIDTTGV